MEEIGTTELCGRAGIKKYELEWLEKKFPGVLVPTRRIGPYRLWPADMVELVEDLKSRIKTRKPPKEKS